MSEMHKLIKHMNQNLNAIAVNQALIYSLLLQYRKESHRRPHNRHSRTAYSRKHPVCQHQQDNGKRYPQHHTD